MRLNAADLFFTIVVIVTTIVATVIVSWSQPATVAVDLAKAKFAWTWTQGTGGPVERWIFRCGPSAGSYNLLVEVLTPNVRSVPVSQIVAGPGLYFCVLQGANSFGAGGASSEVTFQAGTTPAKVDFLEIRAQ